MVHTQGPQIANFCLASEARLLGNSEDNSPVVSRIELIENTAVVKVLKSKIHIHRYKKWKWSTVWLVIKIFHPFLEVNFIQNKKDDRNCRLLLNLSKNDPDQHPDYINKQSEKTTILNSVGDFGD